MTSPTQLSWKRFGRRATSYQAATPAAATPGDQTGYARYRFKTPGVCEYYGLAVGSGSIPPHDSANLGLTRGPAAADPVGFPDVLAVTLGAEPLEFPGVFDGPRFPTVAGAVISTDPDNDPVVQSATAIEFSLEVVDGFPIGSYRLCGPGGCQGSFTPLVPYAPTLFPDALVCGIPASEFDPPFGPFGGGRLQTQNPAAFALYAGFFVPEPSRVLLVSTALMTLAALDALRRRRRSG